VLLVNVDPMTSDLLFQIVQSVVVFLSGLAVGFLSKLLHQRHVDRETRKKFKKMFKEEVEDSIAKLKTHEIHLLPYAVWDAATSSGALRVFGVDQTLLMWGVCALRIGKGMISWTNHHV